MKNKKTLALLIAIAVAAGGYAIYQFGVHQGMQAMPKHDEATAATGPAGKKPLYWHDPMVPGQKFDKPGKSPFMDMQLVPVYAGADSDDGGVAISPRVQQNLGVRTAIVTAGKLPSGVVAVGSVAYNERDVALVQARSNGFVERLYVRAPLDPVRQGSRWPNCTCPTGSRRRRNTWRRAACKAAILPRWSTVRASACGLPACPTGRSGWSNRVARFSRAPPFTRPPAAWSRSLARAKA